jgi:hypothetical protein
MEQFEKEARHSPALSRRTVLRAAVACLLFASVRARAAPSHELVAQSPTWTAGAIGWPRTGDAWFW